MRAKGRSRANLHAGNDLNRWTISFADFMTLMFAVFVVLYAVAISKEEKYKEVIQSIQNASKLINPTMLNPEREQILLKQSNNIIEEKGPAILSDNGDKQAKDQLSDVDNLKKGAQLSELKLELENALLSDLTNASVKLDLEGEWLTIEMGGDLLFVGGSHTLLNTAKQQLERLAKVLMPVNNMLRIRGYTDPEPISNEIYLSNWELSGLRAFAVLHALNALGVDGHRMAMEAYGPYYPVFDTQNKIDNVRSRRVVIAISKYALVEAEVSHPVAPKSDADTNDAVPVVDEIKADSKEMREIHLPNNRLIITTRQE
ncbi:flagellar motor protein MotB [Psychromonas sp. PT13]|uniref:flagellar motor protein MotB n=1 Tax=Psychromonas sp. PT13 TaxID=3439547 RepID=UPI003EB9B7AE